MHMSHDQLTPSAPASPASVSGQSHDQNEIPVKCGPIEGSLLQRRKVSKPWTKEPARKVEKVRYTTDGGGSVHLGQNQAAAYEDKDVCYQYMYTYLIVSPYNQWTLSVFSLRFLGMVVPTAVWYYQHDIILTMCT